jgi:hypothetical protein
MRRSLDFLGIIFVPVLMLILLPGCQAKRSTPTLDSPVPPPATMPDHHAPARTPEN